MYVGLHDKDTKKQVIPTRQAKKIIMGIVGDCTISDAMGYYTHDDGSKVIEKSLRIELLFKADNDIINYCKQLKKELNQESIAVSYSYEHGTLI